MLLKLKIGMRGMIRWRESSLLCFFLFYFIFSDNCDAQWRKIVTFPPPPGYYNSQYCITEVSTNPPMLFVGTETIEGGQIWKSMDNGQHWKQTIQLTLPQLRVNSICFKDSLTGWFTFNEPYYFKDPLCYRTTDAGETWNILPASGGDMAPGFSRIAYYNPYSKLLFVGNWIDKSLQSDNDGDSFTILGTPASTAMSSIVFFDSIHGVGFSHAIPIPFSWGWQPYYLTSDGGKTWIPSKMVDTIETWQPTLLKNKIYIPHSVMQHNANDTTIIYIIDSFTANPKKLTSFPFPITNCIASDSENLYVQTQDYKMGILKSSDEGQSWKSICGPFGGDAMRFIVSKKTGIWVMTYPKMSPSWLWHNTTGRPNGPRVLIDGAGASRDIGIRTGEAVPVEFSYPDDTYFEGIDSVSMIVKYSSGLAYLRDSVSLGWVVIRKEISDTAIRFILRRLDTDAPAAHSGMLKVYFQTYLSIDTSATVSLDEVAFNQDNAARACMLSDLNTSDSIHISFLDRCGDSTLRNFLRELEPIKIITVTPNPAGNLLMLTLHTSTMQEVQFECVNTLGAIVISREIVLQSGDTQLPIDTRDLTSGLYVIRIHTATGSVSKTFLKE